MPIAAAARTYSKQGRNRRVLAGPGWLHSGLRSMVDVCLGWANKKLKHRPAKSGSRPAHWVSGTIKFSLRLSPPLGYWGRQIENAQLWSKRKTVKVVAVKIYTTDENCCKIRTRSGTTPHLSGLFILFSIQGMAAWSAGSLSFSFGRSYL